MRRKIRSLIVFIFTLLLCTVFTWSIEPGGYNLSASGIAYGSESLADSSGTLTKSKLSSYRQGQKLDVHFLSVGHGDCILLTCGDESMMIDFGMEIYAAQILDYLHRAGIKKLKYAVCTHPDPDHIGGMPQILTEFEPEHVLIPDVRKRSAYYKQVLSIIEERECQVEHPIPGTILTLGDAVLTVYYPNPDIQSRKMNDYSIVLRLIHGRNSFLFTGDLLSTGERNLLVSGFPLRAKVLKVGHHGANTSSSKAFLKRVKPSYAVISCGPSPYNHPGKKALKRLRKTGAKMYRTDRQGTIVCSSNGIRLKWTPSRRYMEKIRKK